jgi:hypothetical protein
MPIQHSAAGILRRPWWVVFLALAACNFPAAPRTSAPAGDLPDITAETAAFTGGSGWKVEILSPQPGTEAAAGVPLTVTARCTGGETIEATLKVDSVVEAVHSASITPGETIALEWKSPGAGKHLLAVEFLDGGKNIHAAEMDITVTSGGSSPFPEATPAGASIAFLSLADGAALSATVDPAGFAQAVVTVEAGGDEKLIVVKDVILEADGLQVARVHNDAYSLPFRAELTWTPYRGNGIYSLTAYARTADDNQNYFEAIARTSLTVSVEGLPAGAESLRDRFVRLYSERFGLSIPVPPLGRYIRPNPDARDPSRWVSAVYLGDFNYEIDLFDDGTVGTNRMAVNLAEPGLATICRPVGVLRMLGVVVDYGNTGIPRDQAFTALAAAQAQTADWHRAYAAAMGLSAPLLELHITPAFVSAPPVPGEFLTASQIQSLTGFSTRDYDLVAQIDLDSGTALSAKYGGLGWTLYGGCLPTGSDRVNLYMTVQSPADLGSGLYGSLLVHELSHSLGWQHWWTTGTAGANDQLIWNYDQSAFPFLFFGWTDVDSDGKIEILDPNPFGI